MRTTKHLCRALVASAVRPLGYRVSGNLIFSAWQWSQMERGQYSRAVGEGRVGAYEQDTPRLLRPAELLARTY